MGWVKDRQNTQKPKTEKNKKKESRTHHPKQNSSNVLSVSLLDQVYRLPPLPPTPPKHSKIRGGDPLAGPESLAACGGLWQPVAADGLPLRIEI